MSIVITSYHPGGALTGKFENPAEEQLAVAD
jgi:hypothetical protein